MSFRCAAPTSKLLNAILPADNCMPYSWYVNVSEGVDPAAQVAVNMSVTARSAAKVKLTSVKAGRGGRAAHQDPRRGRHGVAHSQHGRWQCSEEGAALG